MFRKLGFGTYVRRREGLGTWIIGGKGRGLIFRTTVLSWVTWIIKRCNKGKGVYVRSLRPHHPISLFKKAINSRMGKGEGSWVGAKMYILPTTSMVIGIGNFGWRRWRAGSLVGLWSKRATSHNSEIIKKERSETIMSTLSISKWFGKKRGFFRYRLCLRFGRINYNWRRCKPTKLVVRAINDEE